MDRANIVAVVSDLVCWKITCGKTKSVNTFIRTCEPGRVVVSVGIVPVCTTFCIAQAVTLLHCFHDIYVHVFTRSTQYCQSWNNIIFNYTSLSDDAFFVFPLICMSSKQVSSDIAFTSPLFLKYSMYWDSIIFYVVIGFILFYPFSLPLIEKINSFFNTFPLLISIYFITDINNFIWGA